MAGKYWTVNAVDVVGNPEPLIMVRTAVLFSLLVFAIGCGRSKVPFAPEKWRGTPETQRYRQVDDLIDRKVLIGLTASEIAALLGKPSSSDGEPTRLSYVVKDGGTGLNMITFIEIQFDADGKAKSVAVRGD